MGAPEGFTDAVASIVLMTGDGFPEDAGALGRHLRGRGRRRGRRARRRARGRSSPPFDAPWVRTTVLADPQGAVFTASRFVPPE